MLPHLCGNYNRHFYDSYPDLGLSLVSQVVYCTTSGGTIHIDYKMNGTPPPPSYATLLPCLKYAIYILCGQRADSCCQIFFNITCWNSANFFLQNPFQALIRMKLTSSLKGNHPHSDGFCSESKEEKIQNWGTKAVWLPLCWWWAFRVGWRQTALENRFLVSWGIDSQFTLYVPSIEENQQ